MTWSPALSFNGLNSKKKKDPTHRICSSVKSTSSISLSLFFFNKEPRVTEEKRTVFATLNGTYRREKRERERRECNQKKFDYVSICTEVCTSIDIMSFPTRESQISGDDSGDSRGNPPILSDVWQLESKSNN